MAVFLGEVGAVADHMSGITKPTKSSATSTCRRCGLSSNAHVQSLPIPHRLNSAAA